MISRRNFLRMAAPAALVAPITIDEALAELLHPGRKIFLPARQPVLVTELGGEVPFYTWSWKEGGSGIAIDRPFSPETTFTAVGTWLKHATHSVGVAQFTIEDSNGWRTEIEVPVTIERGGSLLAAVTLKE